MLVNYSFVFIIFLSMSCLQKAVCNSKLIQNEDSELCTWSFSNERTRLISPLNVQLKMVFSSFKDIKIIQFSSMQDAFEGFTDQVRVHLFSLLSCDCGLICNIFLSS